MNMRLHPHRSQAGIAIGILIAVILLLIALFLIIYLLITLLRMPPRELPREAGIEYVQYVYEQLPPVDFTAPEAPPGMQYRKVPLLVSTNLQNWEAAFCEVDAAGYIHAPDGSILQLHGDWSEERQEWLAFWPVPVRAGTNAAMFFRLP